MSLGPGFQPILEFIITRLYHALISFIVLYVIENSNNIVQIVSQKE